MKTTRDRGINLPADSDREFIFIHGYTGGPDDFGNLPEILRKEYSASVRLPLLPGHGTSVNGLIGLTHHDLYSDIENTLKQSVADGKKIVLIGLSLGAQVALYFASKYPVAGVIAVCISHDLKFPFNIPGLGLLGLVKKTWNKKFTPDEIAARVGAIYYDQMPAEGLCINKHFRRLVEQNIAKVDKPALFIHSLGDKLCSHKAAVKLGKKMAGRSAYRFLDTSAHSMFFSHAKEKIIDEIVSFVKRENLFGGETEYKASEGVSAIVPAYNEGDRISKVVAELSRAPLISEIIVVDDGSSDNTLLKVGQFEKVKVIRNEKNLGKGASLDKGIKAARNDVVFFCDADLVGFKAEHAEEIIAPVLADRYDMFIGLRSNFMQRTVRAWALNSGERALRKKIWRDLPDYYKHRYRVEAGLNHFVKNFTARGYGAKTLNYSQPIKESKYGFLQGTVLRWRMNFDVLKAYSMRIFLRRNKIIPS